ncbi:MAG: hypothetical protein KGL90_01195 [Burkholderiales bacterium]|nr:hypothetical protein [Burkholderiales bacterium]
MPASRHLILPFAASLSEPCQKALPQLDDAARYPHLHQLLTRLSQHTRREGDEYARSMPHERILGHALGWDALPDGALPWAARDAQASGINVGEQAWGRITPCHWSMGRETLTLIDPDELHLAEADSRSVLETWRPWFEDEGWTLVYAQPTTWYASHPSLDGLPTASLDRVIGRNPDVWMPDHPQARLIKRLQNEVQMLMYQYPLNEQREAAGLLTVNSFWLSGCGRLPPNTVALPTSEQLLTTLRAPMLASNLADWIAAWKALDDTTLRDACAALDVGQRVSLTLCGEQHSLTLSAPTAPSATQRVLGSLRRMMGRPGPIPSALLATL